MFVLRFGRSVVCVPGVEVLTLRGTMNAIGSMAFVVSLYALAISHSEGLTARRGTKHIPRCGSLDLCSSNGCRLSLSYS